MRDFVRETADWQPNLQLAYLDPNPVEVYHMLYVAKWENRSKTTADTRAPLKISQFGNMKEKCISYKLGLPELDSLVKPAHVYVNKDQTQQQNNSRTKWDATFGYTYNSLGRRERCMPITYTLQLPSMRLPVGQSMPQTRFVSYYFYQCDKSG